MGTLKVSNLGTASNHSALDQTLKDMGQGQVRDVSVGGCWDEEFLGNGQEFQRGNSGEHVLVGQKSTPVVKKSITV